MTASKLRYGQGSCDSDFLFSAPKSATENRHPQPSSSPKFFEPTKRRSSLYLWLTIVVVVSTISLLRNPSRPQIEYSRGRSVSKRTPDIENERGRETVRDGADFRAD